MVLGDAACCFNQVYGQGMTTAGLAALMLGAVLDGRPAGASFAQRFRQDLARIKLGPRPLATGQDRRYPGVAGTGASVWSRLIGRHLDRLTSHAAHEPGSRRRFLEVLHLVQPMRELFRPALVARVLPTAPRLSPVAAPMPVWPALADGG